MKTFVLALFLISTVTLNASETIFFAKAYATFEQIDIEAKIEDFLDEFEQAVKSHDAEKIMSFLDADYVAEQHDKFLEGRTEQFLNEFFSGNLKNGEGFKTVPYRDIKKMKRKKLVHDGENFYTTAYEVKKKGVTVICEWSLKILFNRGDITFGLIGAVG